MNIEEIKAFRRAEESGAVEAYINGKPIQSQEIYMGDCCEWKDWGVTHSKIENITPAFTAKDFNWRPKPTPEYIPLTPKEVVDLLGEKITHTTNINVTVYAVLKHCVLAFAFDAKSNFPITYSELMNYTHDGKYLRKLK